MTSSSDYEAGFRFGLKAGARARELASDPSVGGSGEAGSGTVVAVPDPQTFTITFTADEMLALRSILRSPSEREIERLAHTYSHIGLSPGFAAEYLSALGKLLYQRADDTHTNTQETP